MIVLHAEPIRILLQDFKTFSNAELLSQHVEVNFKTIYASIPRGVNSLENPAGLQVHLPSSPTIYSTSFWLTEFICLFWPKKNKSIMSIVSHMHATTKNTFCFFITSNLEKKNDHWKLWFSPLFNFCSWSCISICWIAWITHCSSPTAVTPILFARFKSSCEPLGFVDYAFVYHCQIGESEWGEFVYSSITFSLHLPVYIRVSVIVITISFKSFTY